MIGENIKLVDGVCEIIDARIPVSSRNPDIAEIIAGKPSMIIINRVDQADPKITARWRKYFEDRGMYVLETDAKSGKGISGFPPLVRKMLADKITQNEAKGRKGRPLRIMILGIPNVGKSTFINKLANRKAAITGDKPGVTRGKQWIAVDERLDLLDTPGILWPKFDSQHVGEMLAITNAIKADIIDKETLGANFMLRLSKLYPDAIKERYKLSTIDIINKNGFELLEMAAAKRGFLISKGEYDTLRMAKTLLKEYHEGKLGQISLEMPDE